MGQLIRSTDWSRTALGPIENWPQSLCSALSICINSAFPIAIYWGDELTLLYNDAWSPIPGTKHPSALGKPAIEVWPEIWNDIEPLFKQVFQTGKASRSIDGLLPMQRYGYTEECYFDFTFTPIVGEKGQVEGIFNAVVETTYRVVNERRANTLKSLSEKLNRPESYSEIFDLGKKELGKAIQDIPFSLIYLNNDDEDRLDLVLTAGADVPAPQYVDTARNTFLPFREVINSGKALHLTNNAELFGQEISSAWPEPTTETLIIPVGLNKSVGFFVAGINPRRALDDDYQNFLESVSSQFFNAIYNVRSLEEERKRAEALAEIDRVKTVFFNNVSHEFRTPLTLLTGPIEDMLENSIEPAQRQHLEIVHRNALRLKKLVNTLLDFSRIEAGRIQANYVPTNLAVHTADLASNFRSAIEKAGMKLIIRAPQLSEEIYVDRDMWEKIVLNLLSNAFKYTFEGEIEVALTEHKSFVQLMVRDTGEGIPSGDLPDIFERFKRVEGIKSRSHEGTGIGLSLVQELVKLHSGKITIDSVVGVGTTFWVSIPKGKNHLPADRIAAPSSAKSSNDDIRSYIEEVEQWLPSAKHQEQSALSSDVVSVFDDKPRIILADDNVDLQNYLQRLLSNRFNVVTVANGKEALDAVKAEPPDLVLTDIMMPEMDGLELLSRLKSDIQTAGVPVVLLSARADESARIEGIEAGADDYLVKPFSSRELITRINALITANRVRLETERQVYEILMQAPAFIAVLRGPDHVFDMVNPLYMQVVGKNRDIIGKPVLEALPEVRDQGFVELLDNVYRSGEPYIGNEIPVKLDRADKGKLEEAYVNFIYYPFKDARGNIHGVVAHGVDVTEQVLSRRKIAESEEKYRTIFESMDQGFCIIEVIFDEASKPVDYHFLEVNPVFEDLTGIKNPVGKTAQEVIPNLEDHWIPIFGEVALTGKDARFVEDSSMGRWFEVYAFRSGDLSSRKVAILFSDISERKRAENALVHSENQLRLITDSIPALVSYLGSDECYQFVNQTYERWFNLSSDQIKGKHPREVLGEEAFNRSKPFVQKALSGETVTFETTVRVGNDHRHLAVEYVPDKSEDGLVKGVVVLGHDITMRKKAEEELRQTQVQLKYALSAGSIDVWVFDIATTQLIGGGFLANVFGVDPDLATTSGLPLFDFIKAIHPDDRDRVEKAIAHTIETGENYEAEYRVLSGDQVHWVVARGRVERDIKGKPQMMGVLVDITERKRAEEAIRESEERFQLIAKATNDVIWDWDFITSNLWWNDALEPVFGYKKEDYEGDIFWWNEKLHPDDREVVEESMTRVIEGDGHSWSTEYRFLRADGSYAEVLDRGYIIRNESGEAIRMVGAMQDMTERKRAERALRENERFMKLVTDALPAFIAYISPEERYLFANSAYEKWFELAKEQVIGNTMLEVLGEETYSNSKHNVKKVLAGEFVLFENVIRKGNEVKYVQLEYVPDLQTDGSVKGFVVLAHDITEHKQAQEALKRSEEYYKTMTDNTPVMTWLSDPDGLCTFMNRQWYEYTGQLPKDVLGFGWIQAVHPDDASKAKKIFLEACSQHVPFSLEYRLKGKNGKYRWHIDTGLPKFDEQGKFEGFVGSVIDIHERKVAEEALKDQSERFKLVVNSSPSALVMVNDEGKITMVNSQTESLFGYTREELVGETIEKLVPERFRGDHHHYRSTFNKNPASRPMGAGRNLYALRKDGVEVPVEIALNPIETEEGLLVLSSIVDITERKKAEQALRESEEFSRTLLESTPDCIKALDLEGRLLSINSKGLLMLDIDDFSQYKGKLWTELWKGDYYDEAVMAVEKAKHGHLGHFQGLATSAKGTSRWWDVLVAPVYGAGGNVERLVAVSRDISKLKELEQQKDDFIGIASHELKTPVTSIKAYTQVLQKRIQKTEDELASEMLYKMDGQLNRLTNLIADLLDVTRIEQGRLQFRKEKFEFNELVNEVVEDIRRTSTRHEILCELASNRIILADRDRIGQVITNFLTNAFKYSPRAGKIVVKTYHHDDREVVLSVQDFGLGLAKEDKSKVFERFYRVEGSGYETYPGLGLGLYIAAGIIQRHQGKIWVESKIGKGSTFFFSLPLL